MGLTVTPTPLVAGRSPGVITPVPLAKTPVRVALDPSVMVGEFAVKLVMEGGGGGGGGVWLLDAVPQPVETARPRLRIMASGVRIRRRFMAFPVWRLGRSQRPPRAMGVRVAHGRRGEKL